MGFFNKPTEQPGGALAPLTGERITQALDTRGWKYDVDDDGDVVSGWELGTFWYLIHGGKQEFFSIRSF